MAAITKEEMALLLAGLATKDDIKNCATKSDIEKCASKDDINCLRDEMTDVIRSEVADQIKVQIDPYTKAMDQLRLDQAALSERLGAISVPSAPIEIETSPANTATDEVNTEF